MGGGTLRKSKSSAAAAPAATSTSTGPRVMGRPTRKDDVETGVSSTMTMMTTAATTTTTTTGGTAKMPDGVGDKFESPLERDLAEFDPSGVAASPPSGSESAGGGGSRNAGDGTGRSSRSRGKNRRGHRRRGGRTYARTRLRAGVVRGANRAAYAAGRRRRRMLPSLDESQDPGSAFFPAGGGGRGR